MDTLEQKTTTSKPKTKQPEGNKALRARPVKGEVDDEALSREFMRRFPKLRAALAK